MRRLRRRHCMVVDNYYPDARVEREAVALTGRGYAVDVVCVRRMGEPWRERVGRVTVFRLPGRRRRGEGVAGQLGEYLGFLTMAFALVGARHLLRRYDSVQVHNVPDFLVLSALVPRLTGAAVILDLHDLMPEFFASRFGATMDHPLVRAVTLQERISSAFADRVITVTDLWRRTLIQRGVPAEKVGVVMNLPDERIFHVDEIGRRPPANPVVVIYHGTFTHRYGVDLLLQAVARARERVSLHVILHGEGEYVGELQRLTAGLGLQDTVEFSTRSLPTEDLPGLILRADLGVVPYRHDTFTDGILPTKLMEYAALGVPTIVSRSRAVEEHYTDDMVRFVQPGDVDDLVDALCDLAEHPEERARLAANAHRMASQRRWHDEAETYVSIVESAIADAGRRMHLGKGNA